VEGAVAEDQKERVDRELIELLNEIRIALPGLQVMFAFLLTIPFTSRFEGLSAAQHDVYYAAFLCTAAGNALLMAPSVNHRLRFREYDKERMLFWFNDLCIAGSIFAATAVTCVVFLVTDVVIGHTWAAITCAVASAWYLFFWYVVPLWRRLRGSTF
jgi:hypothetical protein